jgi:hypothetical protein
MDKTSRQALARAERQSRRLPEDAACECGERDIRRLIARTDGCICQRCDNLRSGRQLVEPHHLGGRHSCDLTVALGVNEHRVVTDMQIDWGKDRMQNRDGNLLILLANMAQGGIETVIVLLQRALGYVKTLPALNEDLTELLGPQWWTRCPRFMAALKDAGTSA